MRAIYPTDLGGQGYSQQRRRTRSGSNVDALTEPADVRRAHWGRGPEAHRLAHDLGAVQMRRQHRRGLDQLGEPNLIDEPMSVGCAPWQLLVIVLAAIPDLRRQIDREDARTVPSALGNASGVCVTVLSCERGTPWIEAKKAVGGSFDLGRSTSE